MRPLTSLLFLSLATVCLVESKDDAKPKRELAASNDHGGPPYVTPLVSSNAGVATSTVHSYGPASTVIGTGVSSGVVGKSVAAVPAYPSVVYAQPVHGHGGTPVVYTSAGHSLGGGAFVGPSGLHIGAVSPGLISNVVSSGIPVRAGFGYASGFGYTAPVLSSPTTTSHISIEQPVPVPVFQPVGVPVARPVPYRVAHPYPVHVPKPVAVSIPHPVPINVPRPYPVEVNRPYPIAVPRFVPVPVAQPVPVEVPSPYAVPSPYPVPVSQPFPVEIPVATPVVGVSASTAGVTPSIFSSTTLEGNSFTGHFSGLGLGGSLYSRPITGASFKGSTHFVKDSENFHGAPLRALSGGPCGEKWTGLLTNYGSLTHGSGGSLLGVGHSNKLVSGSYRSVAGSFGKVGASFGTSSHRVKVDYDDDYYPYP